MTVGEQILMWAIGLIATAGGAVIVHLYSLQNQTRDKLQLWMSAQLKELSDGINFDRREASSHRAHIATEIGKLVTREDLRDEMVRIISEIDRRFGTVRRIVPRGDPND